MDFGRDYSFVGKMYPFKDRPDIAIDVLWFPVSLDSPYVPYPNPFVLRNWDRLEQEPQTELGTDQFFRQHWSGPRPINLPGTPCGTADEWANGLLYSVWVNDGYRCSCPEAIYMDFVSHLRCDDGSLIVAPSSGEVEEHINTSHSNHWIVPQTFISNSSIVPGVTMSAPAGTNIIVYQVKDQLNRLRSEFRSTNSGTNFSLRLYDTVGIVRSNLRDAGSLSMNDAGGGHFIDLTTAGDSTFSVAGSWLWSSSGRFRVAGSMQLGVGTTLLAPANTSATLQVAAPTGANPLAFSVGDQSSGTFVPTFEVFDAIPGVVPAHCQMNGSGPGFRYALTMQYTEPMGGLAIQAVNAVPGSNDPLVITNPAGVPQFECDPAFVLGSTQVTPTAGPPLVAGFKLAFRDLNTGIVWFIPLYPAF